MSKRREDQWPLSQIQPPVPAGVPHPSPLVDPVGFLNPPPLTSFQAVTARRGQFSPEPNSNKRDLPAASPVFALKPGAQFVASLRLMGDRVRQINDEKERLQRELEKKEKQLSELSIQGQEQQLLIKALQEEAARKDEEHEARLRAVQEELEREFAVRMQAMQERVEKEVEARVMAEIKTGQEPRKQAEHYGLSTDSSLGFFNSAHLTAQGAKNLGEGGAATVRLTDRGAWKQMTEVTDPARLMREADLQSHFPHPNIMPVKAVTFHKEGERIVFDGLLMPFASGGDLFQLIEKMPQVSLPVLFGCLKGICEAIAHLHEHNIVHGDIKLANFLLADEVMKFGVAQKGMQDVAAAIRLTDFGLAKMAQPDDERKRLSSGRVSGTPDHMAPELYQCGVSTKASDVFAMGMVFYLLTIGKKNPYPEDEYLSVEEGGDGSELQEEVQERLRTEGFKPDFRNRANKYKPAAYSTCSEAYEKLKSLSTLMLHQDAMARPSASSVCHELDGIIQRHGRQMGF